MVNHNESRRTRLYSLPLRPALIILALIFGLVFYGASRNTTDGFSDVGEWGRRLHDSVLQLSKGNPPADTHQHSDVALYYSIATDVQNGDGYYASAHKELLARGYATRSVLNWRPPLLAMLLGVLPTIESGRLILSGLAFAALLMWFQYFARRSGFVSTAFSAAIVGFPLLLPGIGQMYLFHETWGGVLIVLSLAGFANKRMTVCLGAGLLGLLLRETVLLYVLVMLFAAWREGRGNEVRAWIGILVIFCIMLCFHFASVISMISEVDRSGAGWIAIGGYEFITRIARWNIWLSSLPGPLFAVGLPLTVLGLTTRTGGLGYRMGLTIATYLAFFSIVGRPDNSYWGLLVAPLFSFGLLWGGQALGDLFNSVANRLRPHSHASR